MEVTFMMTLRVGDVAHSACLAGTNPGFDLNTT